MLCAWDSPRPRVARRHRLAAVLALTADVEDDESLFAEALHDLVLVYVHRATASSRTLRNSSGRSRLTRCPVADMTTAAGSNRLASSTGTNGSRSPTTVSARSPSALYASVESGRSRIASSAWTSSS